MPPRDPRQDRLKAEKEKLLRLNDESDYVRVEVLSALEGSEPQHYRVTFLCRGIVGIDQNRRPTYGDRHQVEIFLDEDFPADVPRLRWISPIWHPNIQHVEPKGVCVNKPEWLGGMGLDGLCRMMFEMVQYKNYHAQLDWPKPLDLMVAQWVRDYAEPNGIVDKARKIYADGKPFTRPTVPDRIKPVLPPAPPPALGARIRVVPDTPSRPRVRIASESGSTSADLKPAASLSRIRVVENG